MTDEQTERLIALLGTIFAVKTLLERLRVSRRSRRKKKIESPVTELEKAFAFEAFMRGWQAGAWRSEIDGNYHAPEYLEGQAVGRCARKVFAEAVAARLDLALPDGERC